MGKGFANRVTRAHVVGILLAAALLLGGGGSPNREAELVLQCVFALGIAAWFALPRDQERLPNAALIAGVSVLALPLVHLMPLPPAIWSALPGRESVHATLKLVGEEDSWRPLSIAPPKTVGALLALVPATALFLMTASLRPERLPALARLIGFAGLLCVLLGVIQLASGVKPYPDAHPGWLTGLFANRNAAADLLLIAALVWGAEAAGKGTRKVFAYSAFAVCLAGLLATGSRAGIALGVVVLTAQAVYQGGARASRWLTIMAGGAVAALAVLASPLGMRILPRFSTLADARPDLWYDSWVTATAFWPSGAGLGAFVPAFLLYERDGVIDASYPNRAHNDYLELLVETGALAPLMLIVPLVLLLRAWRSGWGVSASSRPLLVIVAGAFVMLGLHSIVDYPLRNMAMGCLAGFLAGCVFAIGRTNSSAIGEVVTPRGRF